MNNRYIKSCKGVGVIEVLIALVVVSFGVLGMAGLQLTGMKHSNGGYNRTKAVLLAENLASRMRANPQGVSAGHYNDFDSSSKAAEYCQTQPDPYCQTYKSSNADESTNAESCTATEMATFDLFSITCGNWSSDDDARDEAKDGVINGLFGGKLEVDCGASCTPPLLSYTVLISWNENGGVNDDESADTAKRVQIRFNP